MVNRFMANPYPGCSPKHLRRVVLACATTLMLLPGSNAQADALDDHIAQACHGLSRDFYNSTTPSNPQDEQILQRLLDRDAATLYTRAKIIGAAHACGEQTDSDLAKLQKQATSTFNGDPALSSRFSQIISCTEARFERLDMGGNWAPTARSCPQAKINLAYYVRAEQPISPDNPPPQAPLAPESGFVEKCKSAGVHFFNKPAEKVRSIAYDWSPAMHRVTKPRYELDAQGKILMIGASSWSPSASDAVDFTETRFDPTLFGMGTAKPKYVRVPHKAKFFGVDTLSADALVTIEVSDPEELNQPVMKQHLLRYTLTVTDRRTDEKLATMVYWVDMVNGVACGANVKNTIDQQVFILQATNIPIVIPPYELKRRKGAWIKDAHEWEPDGRAP